MSGIKSSTGHPTVWKRRGRAELAQAMEQAVDDALRQAVNDGVSDPTIMANYIEVARSAVRARLASS